MRVVGDGCRDVCGLWWRQRARTRIHQCCDQRTRFVLGGPSALDSRGDAVGAGDVEHDSQPERGRLNGAV